MKILAVTSGLNTPSARFRVRQNIPELSRLGHQVSESYPALNQQARLPGILKNVRKRYLFPVTACQVALNTALRMPAVISSFKADVLWIERSFIPGFEYPIAVAKRPRVLDVDDAIWLEGLAGRNSAWLMRQMDGAVVGNDYLAEWAKKFCSNVWIIPTGVDAERFLPSSEIKKSGKFTIGWTGTSGNFAYLGIIEKALAVFLRKYPSSEFVVIADRSPDFSRLPLGQARFIKWTEAIEASALNTFDIGVMPLSDNLWTRGKCSFKLLQYMACAVPVIASPVGMNIPVVKNSHSGFLARSDSEWLDALELLYRDSARRKEMGSAGRKSVIQSFDTKVVARSLSDAFNTFA